MVPGGSKGAGWAVIVDKVEIIDLIDTSKENEVYEDQSMARGSAFGGLLQNKLLVGGGYNPMLRNLQDCKILCHSDNSLIKTLDRRLQSSCVVINQTKLYVTGGIGKKSTEILSLDQFPVKGPELPFSMSSHSMVQIDSKTIYLIGGWQDRVISNKTWTINPINNLDMSSGPNLNEARVWHSCNKMKINGKIILVVAGGRNDNRTMNSVELLDTTSDNQKWTKGINSYSLHLETKNSSNLFHRT